MRFLCSSHHENLAVLSWILSIGSQTLSDVVRFIHTFRHISTLLPVRSTDRFLSVMSPLTGFTQKQREVSRFWRCRGWCGTARPLGGEWRQRVGGQSRRWHREDAAWTQTHPSTVTDTENTTVFTAGYWGLRAGVCVCTDLKTTDCLKKRCLQTTNKSSDCTHDR